VTPDPAEFRIEGITTADGFAVTLAGAVTLQKSADCEAAVREVSGRLADIARRSYASDLTTTRDIIVQEALTPPVAGVREVTFGVEAPPETLVAIIRSASDRLQRQYEEEARRKREEVDRMAREAREAADRARAEAAKARAARPPETPAQRATREAEEARLRAEAEREVKRRLQEMEEQRKAEEKEWAQLEKRLDVEDRGRE
jgi:hypothetical protein